MSPGLCFRPTSGTCGGGVSDAGTRNNDAGAPPTACTGTSSCSNGQICCLGGFMAGGGGTATCTAGTTCPGGGAQVCASNADCTAPLVCRARNGVMTCRQPLVDAAAPTDGAVRPDTGGATDAASGG
ncbi:MAG TPA: hypothetical protein VE987_22985 [Polyangiaceae bacterium]|nr:hypothetical protein [Polyangiaceae bacterium]